MSALVFLSYSLALLSVLASKKSRAGLDGQAYFTMLAFLASTGVNLVYSLADLLVRDNDLLQLVEVPLKVGDFVIIAVFYKFVYEMRVVRLKLECEEYQDYQKRLRRQRIVWSLIYATLILNLVLEFLFSLMQRRRELKFSVVGVVGLASQVLQLVTDQALIVLLYVYFCYFFQMKKQSLTREYGVFTLRQKLLVVWCVIVLVLNGFLIFTNNIVEIMVLLDKRED